jgi:plasmid stability protein
MSANLDQTETAILGRAMDTRRGNWSEAAARSILDIKLTPEDARRRDELAAKARGGNLTDPESAELESYRQVGRILELMKAKAKVSLKKRFPY